MQAETPQNNLRFVLRDGKRILQQGWAVEKFKQSHTGVILIGDPEISFEWRDVPLVEEAAANASR